MLGKLDIHMQILKWELIPYREMYSELIKDINTRSQTIALLKGNTGEDIHNIGFGNDFLDIATKVYTTKVKRDK